jgi:hypothetical protein
MALAVGDSGSTDDEADDGILKVNNGRCVVIIGFVVDAAVAENVMEVSPVPGLLYDPYEINGLFPFICKSSSMIREGSVAVSTALKYELFNREVCGFCVGLNNGLDGNNDGCGGAGVSVECDINSIMDASCIVVDDGIADVCDVKDIGDEGFGDEDSTVNCDDRGVKEEGADEGGINDESNCEDGTFVKGGNDDDVGNVVSIECKDCRSLWVFTELLVVCSTSSIVDEAGDSGVLLVEASELLSGTWVEVKVSFFVTCEWVPVAMSPSSCVVSRTGTAGEKRD